MFFQRLRSSTWCPPGRRILRSGMGLDFLILIFLLAQVQGSWSQRERGSPAGSLPSDPRLRSVNVTRTALASRRAHAYVRPIDSMNDLFSVSSDVKEQKLVFAASHHKHSKHEKHHKKEG